MILQGIALSAPLRLVRHRVVRPTPEIQRPHDGLPPPARPHVSGKEKALPLSDVKTHCLNHKLMRFMGGIVY